MPAGWCPLPLGQPVQVILDNQVHEAPGPKSDRSWTASFHRTSDAWQSGPDTSEGLRKRHDLQGPIDDAFMDRLKSHFSAAEIVDMTLVIGKYVAMGRFMQILDLDQACNISFDANGKLVMAD